MSWKLSPFYLSECILSLGQFLRAISTAIFIKMKIRTLFVSCYYNPFYLSDGVFSFGQLHGAISVDIFIKMFVMVCLKRRLGNKAMGINREPLI